jgi:hypothetical protein
MSPPSWDVPLRRSCGAVLEAIKFGRADLSQLRLSKDRSIWRWFEIFPLEDR